MNALKGRDLDIPTPNEISLAREASRSVVTQIRKIGDGEILRLHFEKGQTPIEMPAAALRKLSDVLMEMAKGNAVTLIPIHADLTTQDAANLLNISRPHLIKLLEREEIEYHMVGTHRRIRASDLKTYMESRDEGRQKALCELSAIAQEDKLGY